LLAVFVAVNYHFVAVILQSCKFIDKTVDTYCIRLKILRLILYAVDIPYLTTEIGTMVNCFSHCTVTLVKRKIILVSQLVFVQY